MSILKNRKFRLCSAVLSFGIAVAALGCVPLVAQVSAEIPGLACSEAKWVPSVLHGQAGDSNIATGVLPALPSLFVEVETQTLTGRLTCADPRPAFYNCGHTKQSVWGCKPDCFIERDGSQYVLESLGRLYSVTGDPDKIRSFLTNEVTVTGELKGKTIKAVAITKTSKRVRLSGMRSEYGRP